MPKVYIPQYAHQYFKMFQNNGWEIVDTVEEADLVQFIGGADVYPDLYGEDVHPQTSFNLSTDERDIDVYKLARHNNIPCAGICRGGQFLHVMNGGKMWQHVDGHGVAEGHQAHCSLTGKKILVTSTHHQMMRGNVGEVILRGSNTSHTFRECCPKFYKGVMRKQAEVEVEAVWHEDTNSLSFQPHPEMCRKESDCQKLYFHYLKHYFNLGD